MKIFVSHSLRDKALLDHLEFTLKQDGIELIFAEHFYDLERNVSDKIENLIKSCQMALILLTENGFNSKFVQQEIGYITSIKLPYIQLVDKRLTDKISGFNFGRDSIVFDPQNLHIAIGKAQEIILKKFSLLKIQFEEEAGRERFQNALGAILLLGLLYAAVKE